MTDDDWIAKQGQVVRRNRDGSIWHVSERLYNIDDEKRLYRLWDDTHTSRSVIYQEDMECAYELFDVVVSHSRKPRHVLDGRLYDD